MDEEFGRNAKLGWKIGTWGGTANEDDAIDILIRQRSEQHGVDDLEHSGIGADGEPQRPDRHGCKAWRTPQCTHCLAKIDHPVADARGHAFSLSLGTIWSEQCGVDDLR